MNTTTDLPEPWFWTDFDYTEQLNKEMNGGHLLASKEVKSIAKRQDNDDVLFQIINDPLFEYVVVHLVWSYGEQNSNYPKTSLFKSWDDVFNNRILADSKEFENG